jgi:hypothetical protein
MRLFERVRSHRSLITKGLIGLGLAAGLSVATAAPAAADPYWGHHGYYGGGYYRPYYPRPYIYVAPRVYYPPPPVYYAPPPVYYPGPAYYPAPAYYAPRPFIGIGIGLPPLVFRIH